MSRQHVAFLSIETLELYVLCHVLDFEAVLKVSYYDVVYYDFLLFCVNNQAQLSFNECQEICKVYAEIL